jgi:Flp pilus assembly protein TadG
VAGHRFFRDARKLFNEFCRARGGNLAVVFALSAVPVVGAIGAAVDFARVSDMRSQLQGALDAAVLAGVTQLSANQVSAAGNMFDLNVNGKYPTSPARSFTQNSDGSLSGTARASVSMSFMSAFHALTALTAQQDSPLVITVTSKAVPGQQATVSPASKVCLFLVNQTKEGLVVNSGAKITAPGCDVHILSTHNTAATFNATLGVNTICIKGASILKNGGVNPPAVTNCATIADPFASRMPTVSAGSCTFNNQTYSGNVTLSPGTYCGSTNFNGSGTLTLSPGLYIIKGGAMTFNSSWTVNGTGVTFYLADQNATLTFNGNVPANLSAPTSGTYANILMFEPTGLSNTNLPINGSSGSIFTGLMYLPSRDVTINMTSNITSNSLTMVFSTLMLNQTDWKIVPSAASTALSSGATTSAYLSN